MMSQTDSQQAEPEVSVGSTINSDVDSAWEDFTSDDSDEAPQQAAEAEEPKPEIEESGAEESDAVDDTGDDPPADTTEETTTEIESEGPAVVEPPSDFNAEEIEKFESLPSEAKELLVGYAKRSQVSRSELSTKLDGLEKTTGSVSEILKPYEQGIANLGSTPAKVIGDLLPFYASLVDGNKDQKLNTILNLARTFGVDLNAPQQEQIDSYTDPSTQKNTEQIDKLGQRLDQRDVADQQVRFAEQQAQQRQNQADVNAFKDARLDGVLLHPHFEAVREEMGHQVVNRADMTMERAYEIAVLMDPEIQKAQAKAKEQARITKATKKALEAKKNNAANKKAASAPVSQEGSGTLKDDVDWAADQLWS